MNMSAPEFRYCRAHPAAPRILYVILLVLAGCGSASDPQNQSGDSAASGEWIERSTEKGPVRLTVRLTPREPRLSDLVQMEVSVSAEPDVEIKAPAFGEAAGDFVVRDYTEVREESRVRAESPTDNTRLFRYQLEPMHAGKHLIRSVAVEFVDHRAASESKGQLAMIESEPLEVLITSELGDEVPDLSALDPMLPPRALEESFPFAWMFLIAIPVLLAAIIFIVRRRRTAETIAERQLTPEEIAHTALARLLGENLPRQGRFGEFYLRLTGIVRYYIEGTTGLRAPEQTTEEFLRAMRVRAIFPPARAIHLQEFLEAADMVKYAAMQPGDGQISLSIDRAREFVGLTRSNVPQREDGRPDQAASSAGAADSAAVGEA